MTTSQAPRSSPLRSRWRLFLGLAISAFFIAFTVRGLKFNEFLHYLLGAQYWWLIPGVLAYFLGLVARTWRWHYMLRHIKSIPMYPLFRLQAIGYMGNNVFPARAGELLRSVVLKQEYNVPVSSSLATVLIERLFDGLTMLLFVFVALPFVDFGSTELASYRPLVAVFTALFLGALAVFLFVAARPDTARRIYEPIVHKIIPQGLQPRILELADRFMLGLESLASGRDVFMIFVTSVVIWLFETMKYWFVMHAFPFAVSFVTLMLMNGVVNLATTLPAAPGYIGTFDGPGIAVLMAAGVDRQIATAYTLVLHVALWLPVTLLGAFYLWRSQIKVDEARVAAIQAQEEEAAS